MDHDTARPDDGTVPHFDRTDDHAVAADVHAIANNRTVIGLLPHSYGRGVTQRAIRADDRFVVNDESISVEQLQSGAHVGFVVQFDAELPIHEELVNREIGQTEPTQPPRQAMQLLGKPKGGQHKLAADIARISGPILQDASGHLVCGTQMNIRFYLPESHMPSVEKRAVWFQDGAPVLEEAGKVAASQSWIYRTWSALSRHGCQIELVHEFPERGCVIALSGTLSSDFRAPEGVFLAGIVADGLPHPAAHLHILQNAAHARKFLRSVFMPHWPQPGLVPRDTGRASALERVAFFGAAENLAAELKRESWQDELKRRVGAVFEIRGVDRWSDYSEVDAVVAVRDFRPARQLHKPATKLYNAWLAGVPFIGGTESAYAAEGEAGRDYLAARSPEEVISLLEKLKNNRQFRSDLVRAGKEKSVHYTHEAITSRWKILVGNELPAMARHREQRPRWVNRGRDFTMRGLCAMDRLVRD